MLFRTFELDLAEQTGDLHGVDCRPLGPGLHHQLQVVVGELLHEAAGDACRVHVVRRRSQLLFVSAVHLGTLARNLYRYVAYYMCLEKGRNVTADLRCIQRHVVDMTKDGQKF